MACGRGSVQPGLIPYPIPWNAVVRAELCRQPGIRGIYFSCPARPSASISDENASCAPPGSRELRHEHAASFRANASSSRSSNFLRAGSARACGRLTPLRRERGPAPQGAAGRYGIASGRVDQLAWTAAADVVMNERKSPIFTVSGAGLSSTSVIDLTNEETALDVGRRIAALTGRTLTVRDEEGLPLATFESARKN